MTQLPSSLLVIDLIVSTKNDRIFEESILLGIALLRGGNTQIQNSFYNQLHKQKKSEKFFKVFYDRMELAQKAIRSSVSVNMFELSCRKREEEGEGSGIRYKKVRDSLHLREDIRGQLKDASSVTSKAYSTFRLEVYPEMESMGSGGDGMEEVVEETQMSQAIIIMKPILRFLQLLCENHNRDLQNFLRDQNNKTNYNLVCETLQFLDCICGSTTGGLGLLGLYINERNVDLVKQTLETITEYCQGPCHENQTCIARHESNGIDIIIALIVNPIDPLGKNRLDLVLELKNNASKLLLAIMESRHDSENADKILYKMRPNELVDVIKEAYIQGDESEIDHETSDQIRPKDVGHNIYILAHQLLNKIVFLVSFVGNQGTFTRGYKAVIMDVFFLLHVSYVIVCMLGLFVHEFFYSILLFDLVRREETLLNVMRSVTKNGRSIFLTAVLAIILVYLFSIVGFLFFKDDFLMQVDRLPALKKRNVKESMSCQSETCSNSPFSSNHEEDEDGTERVCDTLLMCIITVLNHGLRNGGGIADVLRKLSKEEPMFPARVVYDLLFFFIVIIIVLNLIFGVIIDTFADLRSEKQRKEEILKTTCFICGLERDKFDNKTVSFEEHIKSEHSMWHYLYFLVLVKVKDPTEYTGPESYVAQMIKEKNLDWFPRMRAMSLVSSEGESEQNEIRLVQERLDTTITLVAQLTSQLSELKEQMTEQRKNKQRLGFLGPSQMNHQIPPAH
ncbi:inositol 1,4,5-trisphosphate receptor type 2-like [Sinocyclocheilus grahami]|uniref:inositol 1,4,5-trisphosphate receptor type 2-like n=1 Tax=Sinocyclocheilus grahami TaxID=75366 RepID=UPI0007AC746B|nr:PREDICTED: inositol 1,4,5-trisphosphate receptor type 2-like [Sinocyclocheilus grahami]